MTLVLLIFVRICNSVSTAKGNVNVRICIFLKQRKYKFVYISGINLKILLV